MPSKRYSITITGVSSESGYMTPYFPDYMIRPFNIGVGCIVSSTNIVYTVEHSFDYTGSSTFISSNATWFPNSGITAKTTNQDGNYAYPVTAIRVQSSAGSSIGTVNMVLIQAG